MRATSMLVLLLFSLLPAIAQTPVRDGDMERLVLSAGSGAASWSMAEATMGPAQEPTRDGNAVHHLHIDVDHNAGEKAYPIGWPRTNLPFTEPWQRDWSGYDFLEFWVYSETSREALPAIPLGMLLHTPDRAHQFSLELRELRKGEWVQVRIPISRIGSHQDVRLIQFFISESNYADRDVLDFYISDISLLRFAEPHLSDVAVKPAVAYSDAAYLRVTFQALGVAEGATGPASVSVADGERELVSVKQDVKRGPGELLLDLRGRGMKPGRYTVRVSLGDAEPQERVLRLVPSPWE